MTLRLRLTLFYTALVAIILVFSGISLHLLFQQRLQSSFDQTMREASQLLLSTLEDEGHEDEVKELELHIDPSSFPSDQTVVIRDQKGELHSLLGGRPENLTALLQDVPAGFSSQGSWRRLLQPVAQYDVIMLRSTESLRQTLAQFDRLFFILVPLALLVAFGLGYLLAQQALRPVDRLTRAAYDLAKRRAWRESLPEPKHKDELWRLSSATNTLLASLQEVIESERRFTADAAHELRTPLTVLQGRLEQVLEANTDPHNRVRLVKAHEATETLLRLVDKLLRLARTEAGQGLQQEPLALDELAFHTAESLKPLFDDKHLLLKLELPADPVWIQGDRMALDLLIRNLLENALKFTQQGCISVSVTQGHQHCTLKVEDSGPGLPEEAIEHIFERFYQADARHRRQGSGLGLALVKSIADWHGGTISAHNLSAGGALFQLELPRLRD